MTEIMKEYAEALFALAGEEHSEKAISEALHFVADTFAANPDYIEFLASPGIPAAQRTASIECVFAGKIPECALSFTQLLCEKGHIRSYASCLAEYDLLYRASMEISSVRIVSAVPLTDAEKDAMVGKLAAISEKQVLPVYEVDENLLGGVVVHMDGKVIDGSLRYRLQDMKEAMEG